MRWKLLALVSIIAALSGAAIWSIAVVVIFGSARAMARNDWILLGSVLIPLGICVFGGVFVYRHTARRRKTQAVITVILSLLLTSAFYLAGATVFTSKLHIPTTTDVRHAR